MNFENKSCIDIDRLRGFTNNGLKKCCRIADQLTNRLIAGGQITNSKRFYLCQLKYPGKF